MRIVLRNGFAHPQQREAIQYLDIEIERAAKRQLRVNRVSFVDYSKGQLLIHFRDEAAAQLAARATLWSRAGDRVLAVLMLPGDGRAWLVANGFMFSDYEISEEDLPANDA